MERKVLGVIGNTCSAENFSRMTGDGSDYVRWTWDCGCWKDNHKKVTLCQQHKELPPINPVLIDFLLDGTPVIYDTNHSRKIRRRIEEYLRNCGDGAILKIAQQLDVKIE